MTAPVLPAADYLGDAARTNGEMKQALDDQRDVVAMLPGGVVASELTISSGSITPTGGVHTVDTEGDAASDDLDTIAVTSMGDGCILVLSAEHTDRSVVLKDGSDNIHIAAGADLTLDNDTKFIGLINKGGQWYELFQGLHT